MKKVRFRLFFFSSADVYGYEIFTEVLSSILSLIDRPGCRYIALQAYAIMTHYSPTSFPPSIMNHVFKFLQLIKQHPSDPKLAELCVTILAQSTLPILVTEETHCINTSLEKCASILYPCGTGMHEGDVGVSVFDRLADSVSA